jgi:hypothetical protein
MNPSSNVSFTKRTLVGWMCGSLTPKDGIALAEGLCDLRTSMIGGGRP